MTKLYSVTGRKNGEKRIFSDSYKTLALARSFAKQFVKENGPGSDAVISKELTRPIGHEIGAHWMPVSVCKYEKFGGYKFFAA